MAVGKTLSGPVCFRIGGFFIFQVAFLCLALVCAHSPLPIKLVSTSSEVRGAFSIVFVAWQFIAALLITDLLLRVFSEEWSFYLTQRPFQPGCDGVSTLTANVFFHARHTFTRSTSLAYKAACSVLVLITILRTIGPASISTDIAPRTYPKTIGLARFTPTTFESTNRNDPVLVSIQRAEVITRIEQEMKTIVGWNVTDNVLIGRPKREVVTPNTALVYPSDVVEFDFRCAWMAPQIQQDQDSLLFLGNGTQWKVWNAQNSGDITVGIYTLYDSSESFDGQSAYLFVGCNSTTPGPPCLIEFDALPSTNISAPPQSRIPIPVPATLLTTVLTCNSNYRITTSQVELSGTTFNMIPSSEGLPTQNNLPPATTELILSSALLGVLTPLSTTPGIKPNLLSTIAARTFLDSHGQNAKDWINQMNFTTSILGLDAIERNLNAAMISASKAFLIEPSGPGFEAFAGFETFSVPASVGQPVVLLIGSNSFIFSTIGLLACVITCGILIVVDTRSQHRLPLDLQTILSIFPRSSASKTVLPVSPGAPARDKPLPLILGTYIPVSLDDDSSDDGMSRPGNDVHWYWPRKYVITRVVLFLILQLGYYGFAIGCHKHPVNISRALPVPLINYSAELKGAFIIAFTAWHTLSIALLNDIIFTVFSLEWGVQAEKKCILEPGQTDRVSTPASGLFDRVKYAFTRSQRASGMFRYALAASIALMVIAATGPGCFTLSTTSIVNQNITLTPVDPKFSWLTSTPFTPGSLSDQAATLMNRAASITYLEQIEGFTWGYNVPSNMFTPWRYHDNGSFIHEQANVLYQNDTRHFATNCRWEPPSTTEITLESDIARPVTAGVVPVVFMNATRTSLGHSGLLLVGCEPSDSGKVDCALDMTGVPNATPASNGLWNGTAVLLACDASNTNFSFSSAAAEESYRPSCSDITLTNSHITARGSGCELINYNPPDNFGSIFASSLLLALRPPLFAVGSAAPGDIGIGVLAGQLLFDDFTTTFNSTSNRLVSQIQMSSVETKMNRYLTSATKIFMAGYYPSPDAPSSVNFIRFVGPEIGKIGITVNQMTLVGNKAMIISSMILLAISLRFLQLSLRSVFWKQSRLRKLEPFGVESVMRMRNWLENLERLRRLDEDH